MHVSETVWKKNICK